MVESEYFPSPGGIKITEILQDPTGQHYVGEIVGLLIDRSGAPQIDQVVRGDYVEVYGEQYWEHINLIELKKPHHYLKKLSGQQGALAIFDLDYRGTPPNSDGNNQTSITVAPGAALTLFFRYNEGSPGNQYIIRVYGEWDKNRVLANSDNDEQISEVGAEIGGYRWDKESYTAPSTPGTYKFRVVYSASATPPTWDRYDRLLAEGSVTITSPKIQGYYVVFVDAVFKDKSSVGLSLYSAFIESLEKSSITATAHFVRFANPPWIPRPGESVTVRFGNPDVTANGEFIVFPAEVNGDWNIYVGKLNIDPFSHQITVTDINQIMPLPSLPDQEPNASHEEDPRFSWDGRYIIFKQTAVFQNRRVCSLVIYDKDRRTLGSPIQDATAELWAPFFSPDGKKVVFTRRINGNDDLWLYDLNNGELKKLTTTYSRDWYPVFIDKNRIVFIKTHLFERDDLAIMYIDRTPPKEEILKHPLCDEDDPYPVRESNVVTWIAFINNCFSTYQLAFMNINTRERRNVKIEGVNNILGPVVFYIGPTTQLPQHPAPPPPSGLTLTIEEAVARLVPGDPSNAPDPNRVIGDQEILQAMRFWKNREPVPNTGGQVISDEKMMELLALWTKGAPIKAASASTGVALEMKQIGFTGSRFFAQGSGIKSIGVQVWDLAGKLIFSKEESGSVLAFNDRTLANGVYLYVVTVRGSNGEAIRSDVRKLVILR